METVLLINIEPDGALESKEAVFVCGGRLLNLRMLKEFLSVIFCFRIMYYKQKD